MAAHLPVCEGHLLGDADAADGALALHAEGQLAHHDGVIGRVHLDQSCRVIAGGCHLAGTGAGKLRQVVEVGRTRRTCELGAALLMSREQTQRLLLRGGSHHLRSTHLVGASQRVHAQNLGVAVR